MSKENKEAIDKELFDLFDVVKAQDNEAFLPSYVISKRVDRMVEALTRIQESSLDPTSREQAKEVLSWRCEMVDYDRRRTM